MNPSSKFVEGFDIYKIKEFESKMQAVTTEPKNYQPNQYPGKWDNYGFNIYWKPKEMLLDQITSEKFFQRFIFMAK